MPCKISLAGTRAHRRIGKLQPSTDDVGLDSGRLDGTVVGRVIAGGGQFQCCPVVHGKDGLYGTLAESLGPEYQRPTMVLQRAGDDLGGRSRTPVDQHHHRGAVEHIAAGSAEGVISISGTPPGRNDNPFMQEKITHLDCAIEHPARIVAKIQHQPAERPTGLLFEPLQLSAQ